MTVLLEEILWFAENANSNGCALAHLPNRTTDTLVWNVVPVILFPSEQMFELLPTTKFTTSPDSLSSSLRYEDVVRTGAIISLTDLSLSLSSIPECWTYVTAVSSPKSSASITLDKRFLRVALMFSNTKLTDLLLLSNFMLRLHLLIPRKSNRSNLDAVTFSCMFRSLNSPR